MIKEIKNKKSHQLSKLLRHDPNPLIMDSFGWINCVDMCQYLNITMEDLVDIVLTNDKQRFSFNDDKTSIRANQGHSINIAPDKEYVRITTLQEEELLYHGTDNVIADIIKDTKILPGNRQFVHWTKDIELATKRANQRAFHNKTNPVLIILKARSYIHSNGKLLIAENDVYLTPEIDGNKLEYKEI